LIDLNNCYYGAREDSSVASDIIKPPSDWKRPKGRPSHAWLRAIEADLKPLNIDLWSAWSWKKATIRETWRSVVDTSTLKKSWPYVMRRRREESGKMANRLSNWVIAAHLYTSLKVQSSSNRKALRVKKKPPLTMFDVKYNT